MPLPDTTPAAGAEHPATDRAPDAQRLPGVVWRGARDIGAALVVGLAALSFYVSTAGLLFQGVLAPYLPVALGATLVGGAILALAAAWRGTLPLASAGAVPAQVSVLAGLCAAVGHAAGPDAALPNVVVALGLTAAALGCTWWFMGRRGWGGLIRYMPYPVVGGFMGATGWLLATGGLGVAIGQPFSWTGVVAWDGGILMRSGVCCAIGIVLLLAGQRFKHLLVLPGLLLAGALAIHGGLAVAGIDLAAAQAQGWLQKSMAPGLPLSPLQPALWQAVHWQALLPQAGWLLSFVIVGTLALLLTTSSLELAWDTRGDINRDLQALGQGNLLAAAMGGLAGSISLSRSMLNRAAGARGRASGVMLALLCLLALAWGGPVMAQVPLPLLGGLLLAQGLEMLKTWLLDSRSRLPRRDHLTVIAIIVATVLLGFLPAVCLGVLACCVDLAVKQAQFPPVRRLLSRAGWHSNVERPAAQTEWLMQRGAGLQIVELQGVIFFGSATRLARQVEPLLEGAALPCRLLFDFSRVRLLDTSAAQALATLFKRIRQQGAEVELCGLHGAQQAALQATGARALALPLSQDSIDTAVAAWDEAQLATQAKVAPARRAGDATLATPPAEALAAALGPPLAARLMTAFRPVSLAAGQVLFERGAAPDALYLLASGRLAVVVAAAAGAGPSGSGTMPAATEMTVRTVLPGSTVGEMGLFRGQPRSATVRALEASELLALDAARLTALEAEDPAAAAALYRVFVSQMASRVDQLTAQSHLGNQGAR